MENFQVQVILQLLLALVLGGVIGLERECKRKGAGLQTYSLVTLGACVFTIASCEIFYYFLGQPGVSFDPSRAILAVATGIGFIGAGVIIYRGDHIEGLTTAAGLWTVSAIGVAVGMKLYFLAVTATLLAIIILIIFGELEKKILKK